MRPAKAASPASPIDVTPPGLTPAAWASRLRTAPLLELPDVCDLIGARDRGARLLVLAAHPDDETIGSGRLISEWGQTIGPVTTVLATNGEACFDHIVDRPAGLGARRQQEWREAIERLGVDDGRSLDLDDGQLDTVPTRLESAFRRAISDVVDDAGPGSLVLAAPYSRDPHPDHRAAGRVTESVARQIGLPYLGYPVWLTYWMAPDDFGDEPIWRLAVSPEAEHARDRALECFVTQLEPMDDRLNPVVPPEMLDHHDQQLLLPGAGR